MNFAPHARVARVAADVAFLFQRTFTTPRMNSPLSPHVGRTHNASKSMSMRLSLRLDCWSSSSAVCVPGCVTPSVSLCVFVCVCECPFVDSVLQMVGGLGIRWIATAAVCMYWCVSRQKRDKNENCLVYFIKSISRSSSSMFMRAYMTCTCACLCVCLCVDDDEAAKKSVKAKSETGEWRPHVSVTVAASVAVSAAAAVGLLRSRRVGAAVCVGF